VLAFDVRFCHNIYIDVRISELKARIMATAHPVRSRRCMWDPLSINLVKSEVATFPSELPFCKQVIRTAWTVRAGGLDRKQTTRDRERAERNNQIQPNHNQHCPDFPDNDRQDDYGGNVHGDNDPSPGFVNDDARLSFTTLSKEDCRILRQMSRSMLNSIQKNPEYEPTTAAFQEHFPQRSQVLTDSQWKEFCRIATDFLVKVLQANAKERKRGRKRRRNLMENWKSKSKSIQNCEFAVAALHAHRKL
jgi:hypothetical protein